VANEGRFVAFVARGDADRAVEILRRHPVASGACAIGSVGDAASPIVVLKSLVGSSRIVDMLSGEQLPRIC
jgi:hydrogenase expression/formation protein HypE